MTTNITPEAIETASLVLAKCAAFDPYFPGVSEGGTVAWAEALAESRLSREDLLAGVARMYREAGENGVRPIPAFVIRHAKAAYRDAIEALPLERRALMVEAEHALQDMGRTPNEAHRAARRIALGRNPGPSFTRADADELRARLTVRRELESGPSRGIALGELVSRAFQSVGGGA